MEMSQWRRVTELIANLRLDGKKQIIQKNSERSEKEDRQIHIDIV